LEYHAIRPCQSSAAIEAVPKAKVLLNLNALENGFTNHPNYSVEANVGSLLIVNGEFRISIYPSGKLILNTCQMPKAMRVIQELSELLDSAIRN
jgi:hypothetical protein